VNLFIREPLEIKFEIQISNAAELYTYLNIHSRNIKTKIFREFLKPLKNVRLKLLFETYNKNTFTA